MDAAPDLPTLFEFELQIEAAAVAVLTAAGVPAFAERNAADQSTPRVEVKLVMGAPTGHRYSPTGAQFSPSQTLPDAWHAQLALTTVTNRRTADNGSRHDELLGKSRVAMLQAPGNLNAQLAWLTVQRVADAGVIPTTQLEKDLDVSPAVFALQFAVLPGAWPGAQD